MSSDNYDEDDDADAVDDGVGVGVGVGDYQWYVKRLCFFQNNQIWQKKPKQTTSFYLFDFICYLQQTVSFIWHVID